MSEPTALYTVAEIRAIEAAAQSALPPCALMQRAGQAAAQLARTMLAAASARSRRTNLVKAGPGNNGGDALEAAALLAQENFQVRIILLAAPERLPHDAQQALSRARASAASFESLPLLADLRTQRLDLVIDGLFGIGLMRPLAGEYRAAVESINALACPVLSLDVPSGLNSDTGMAVGPVGIADRHFMPHHACLSTIQLFRHALRRRPCNSHKGSFGDVAVIGGAHGMSGAPILSARAAAHCGAGRVFAGFLDHPPAYDSVQPELKNQQTREQRLEQGTLVVGPGLGTSRAAHDMLAKALASPAPAVLDADALNLIAKESGLQQKTAQRKAETATVNTPHTHEAARLHHA